MTSRIEMDMPGYFKSLTYNDEIEDAAVFLTTFIPLVNLITSFSKRRGVPISEGHRERRVLVDEIGKDDDQQFYTFLQNSSPDESYFAYTKSANMSTHPVSGKPCRTMGIGEGKITRTAYYEIRNKQTALDYLSSIYGTRNSSGSFNPSNFDFRRYAQEGIQVKNLLPELDHDNLPSSDLIRKINESRTNTGAFLDNSIYNIVLKGGEKND